MGKSTRSLRSFANIAMPTSFSCDRGSIRLSLEALDSGAVGGESVPVHRCQSSVVSRRAREGSGNVMGANRLRLGAWLCAALALPAVCTEAQRGTAQGTPQ